jgi:hypothetical protein
MRENIEEIEVMSGDNQCWCTCVRAELDRALLLDVAGDRPRIGPTSSYLQDKRKPTMDRIGNVRLCARCFPQPNCRSIGCVHRGRSRHLQLAWHSHVAMPSIICRRCDQQIHEILFLC